MTIVQDLLALMPAAYLAGSIPFGLLVGWAKGIDPRKAGSGNIGATNLGRLLGGRYFALVFILDMLKGLLPMVAGGFFLHWRAAGAEAYALWMGVGFAAILGHLFSVFLRFKGGKGVATSAGVILGLWPYYTLPGLVGAALFLVLFRLTRYVSVASMGAACAFPILYLLFGELLGWPVLAAQWPLLAFAVLVAGLIVWKHRKNIARLRNGTEHRFAKPAG